MKKELYVAFYYVFLFVLEAHEYVPLLKHNLQAHNRRETGQFRQLKKCDINA